MLHSFRFDNVEFTVDLENDFYGADYWNRVSRSEYEPDTLDFLRRNCSAGTLFMDIGAANGAMTLIAGSLGSTVYSYEPDPLMFNVTKRNVELNSRLKTKVSVINRALAANQDEIIFSQGSNQNVLSNIVFSGERGDNTLKVQVTALHDELASVHKDTSNLVIKMDIEGAEWGILGDERTVISLHSHQAKILLAVHPGFHRPHKKIMPGIDRIFFEFWRFKNYREARKLFNRLSKSATIKRTNLNPITDSRIFASLCLVGYHEFVIDFRKI